jgi:hypothetical protein
MTPFQYQIELTQSGMTAFEGLPRSAVTAGRFFETVTSTKNF